MTYVRLPKGFLDNDTLYAVHDEDMRIIGHMPLRTIYEYLDLRNEAGVRLVRELEKDRVCVLHHKGGKFTVSTLT